MMTASTLPGRQRAEAYWFLASLFGRPIGPDALQRIVSVNAAIPSEEQGIAAELHAALAGESDWGGLAQRLAAEHARLFLGLREGHGPPPPYESLWREGRVAGDSTLAVAAAYSEAGFDDNGPWGPCDHIAYELRFMASLCNAEDESAHANAVDEAGWARERQALFLDEHLEAWVPRYCKQVAAQAREPLYQALASVTERVVSEDARYLRTTHPEFGARTIPSTSTGADKGVGT